MKNTNKKHVEKIKKTSTKKQKNCFYYSLVTIGRCKIRRLTFEDNSVSLASSESGSQHALNGFAVTCSIDGIKSAFPKLSYFIF